MLKALSPVEASDLLALPCLAFNLRSLAIKGDGRYVMGGPRQINNVTDFGKPYRSEERCAHYLSYYYNYYRVKFKVSHIVIQGPFSLFNGRYTLEKTW